MDIPNSYIKGLIDLREQFRKGTISKEEFIVKSMDQATADLNKTIAMKPSLSQENVDKWCANTVQILQSHFIATLS